MMELTGLLLLELVLYASCFVCGIVTAASLTIVQGNFGGLCMLYGAVSYNATASVLGVQDTSSASLCYFVSAISVMVAVLCFSLSLYWLYAVCIDGDARREVVWMNVTVGMSGIFLFFLLISGCVLKIGRDTLCNSVTRSVPNMTSCEEAQTKKWVSPIKGDNFFTGLQKAEVSIMFNQATRIHHGYLLITSILLLKTAVWVNFFLWLLIGALIFIQRRQSLGPKVITGGLGGPTGGLFGDPGVTAAETEPFFNHPARPQ
ncbi:transmembrane protein 179B isoform X1 [Syngnathus scovelli]|uniref:transmembrane protein 179B isoform X1 n=1 Tax=Syngnathus scovelli TaxID=161590 RepID=UPI00210FFEE2|nr:transmembrane protein 179B isoform X1 [Syngnathus scovelli]XP_049613778.1 transmembrane protein 179B isoform X1 [Syngnathus scovelli]